jgi:hypothetical protein
VSTTGDGAVSVVSNSPSVCSVSGLTITYLAVGTCSLTASVADGINYAGAVGTAQTFSLSAEVTTTTTTTVVTKVGQSKLFISNTRVIFPLHAKVTLTTRGGSGTGAVSFKLLHGACVLRGNQLSVHTAHACTVIANKAGDSHYTPQNSSPVTFLIGFKVQAPLSLRVSSKVARHSARVSLSTSGGSGRGAVHFSVKGKHCFLRGDTLGASRATSCVVSATKAGSGSYLAVTSKSVKVKFT